eukprot:6213231-Pleurochrysis_carterae.AAC.4
MESSGSRTVVTMGPPCAHGPLCRACGSASRKCSFRMMQCEKTTIRVPYIRVEPDRGGLSWKIVKRD